MSVDRIVSYREGSVTSTRSPSDASTSSNSNSLLVLLSPPFSLSLSLPPPARQRLSPPGGGGTTALPDTLPPSSASSRRPRRAGASVPSCGLICRMERTTSVRNRITLFSHTNSPSSQPPAFTVRGARVRPPILLAEALHVDQRRGQVRLIPPNPSPSVAQPVLLQTTVSQPVTDGSALRGRGSM